MESIEISQLSFVVGGQQAEAPAPDASSSRSERDDDDRERETERFRKWERRHPFQAMLCQGDRDCAEAGGFERD